MKSSRLRIALLALLCGTTSLHADILIMKDGSKIEGSILQESPEAIRIKYRLTPKIWDEKSVLRTDIQEVIKQSPQEVEVIELRKVLPTADLVTTDEYEQLIQDRLRPFVNKYKDTKEATEVEGIIAKLQEEKSKVSNGQLKFEGKWLTAQQAKGEKFNIEAYKILASMRALIAQGKWSLALQEYDKLARGEPVMRATRFYPVAITEAQSALESWGAILTKMAADHPVLKKTREEGLKKLEGMEKTRTEAAVRGEMEAWRAKATEEKSRKLRWIEPNKYDMPSIQAAQKEVTSERARLQDIDLETVKAQNEAFGTVLAKIGEGDYNGGAAAFARVANFGNSSLYKNSQQAKETKDIIDDLKGRLLGVYRQIVAKQSTGAVITKGSSAIGGSASTGVDDRVAKILADAGRPPAGAAPAAPATGAVAPMPGVAAPVAAPGTIAPAPGTAPVARPAAAPGTVPGVNPAVQQPNQAVRPMPQPVAAPVAAAAPVAPAPLPEESNFQMYLLIGAGVLILILLIALMNKKK
jgi:hypothetical protein